MACSIWINRGCDTDAPAFGAPQVPAFGGRCRAHSGQNLSAAVEAHGERRELVRQSDVDALIDELVGVTLTAMSSMPARCAPRGNLATRRCIEQVVFEVRTEIANIAKRKADEAGEPPLSEQG